MFITEADFTKYCADFICASNYLLDGWQLKTYEDSQSPVLQKKFTKHLAANTCKNQLKCDDSECGVLNYDDSDEDAVGRDHISTEEVTLECHVVYKEAFSNAALYFLPSWSNGEMLTLEDCWTASGLISSDHRHNVTAGQKWTFLTQAQHPYLNTPFFVLHPCHIGDVLEPLSKTSNYIMAWLSVVAPVFDLEFFPEAYDCYFESHKTD